MVVAAALCASSVGVVAALAHDVSQAPLPYPNPRQVVRAFWQPEGQACAATTNWYNKHVPYALAPRVLDAAADVGQFAVEGQTFYGMARGIADSVDVGLRGVSPSLFSILGVPPTLGRPLTESDGRPGSAPAVVLSHSGWLRLFGLAPSALGQRITVAGVSFTVVGVMPKAFLGEAPELGWVPIRQSERLQSPTEHELDQQSVDVVGRLRSNLSFAQATAIVEARSRIVRDAGASHAGARGERDARMCLVSIWEAAHPPTLVSFARLPYFPLGLLMVAAVLSIFLVWLGRNSTDQQGIVVMASLGASRWAVLRSRVAESIIVAGLAAAVGLALTIWAYDAVQVSLARAWWISRSSFWLALPVAIGLAGGMIVLPAIAAAMSSLRALGRHSATGRGAWARAGHGAMRRAVAIQAALAVVVFAMGLAPAVELARLQWADLGFDAAHTLLVTAPPAAGATTSSARWRTVVDSLEMAVRDVPGITAQGVFQFVERRAPVSASPATSSATGPRADSLALAYADAGFFDALAMRPIAGRLPSAEETQRDAPVAVLSATAARRLFGRGSPLGQTLTATTGGTRRVVTVIGVVPDVALLQRSADGALQLAYSPAWRDTTQVPVIYAQTRPAAAAVQSAAVRSLGRRGATPGARVEPWGTFRRIQLALLTLPLKVMSFLVLITWITAAMGLYGLVTYTVERRLHELGIRAAVGATPWQNARLIARWIAVPVVFGAGIGVALSLLFAAPLLTMLHFGALSAWMPLVAAASFCVVAILAGLFPTMRGLRAAPHTIMNAL